MKKKMITKNKIMNVYFLTQKEIGIKSHFGRIIDWFELEGYNITHNSVSNIYKYMEQRRQISELLNNTK
jgi:hypothetical protein